MYKMNAYSLFIKHIKWVGNTEDEYMTWEDEYLLQTKTKKQKRKENRFKHFHQVVHMFCPPSVLLSHVSN